METTFGVAALATDCLRSAERLGYASQREDAKGRAQLQAAAKIYRQLGGEGHWMDDAPPKPKWMRWRTYERKTGAAGLLLRTI